MAITTFDTHKFVRRLEEAGMPLKQAEVQAEVLTEAFNVNLEELVTKDYLAAQFAEQNAAIDARFAEYDAKYETKFAELSAKLDAKFTLLQWMVGIVMAALVIPLLQQLIAL
ncbi:MAG: CCDC90 family protein [Pseudomonadales bacterium]|nr:CCDC90 family protein [Pseudomonadales bacterium]